MCLWQGTFPLWQIMLCVLNEGYRPKLFKYDLWVHVIKTNFLSALFIQILCCQ
jgi:hypothetical protein